MRPVLGLIVPSLNPVRFLGVPADAGASLNPAWDQRNDATPSAARTSWRTAWNADLGIVGTRVDCQVAAGPGLKELVAGKLWQLGELIRVLAGQAEPVMAVLGEQGGAEAEVDRQASRAKADCLAAVRFILVGVAGQRTCSGAGRQPGRDVRPVPKQAHQVLPALGGDVQGSQVRVALLRGEDPALVYAIEGLDAVEIPAAWPRRLAGCERGPRTGSCRSGGEPADRAKEPAARYREPAATVRSLAGAAACLWRMGGHRSTVIAMPSISHRSSSRESLLPRRALSLLGKSAAPRLCRAAQRC